MADPIIVRDPLYTDLLWRLPHNVYQRRGSLCIIGATLGHLREQLSIAEVAATFSIADIILAMPEGLARSLPAISDIRLLPLPETGTGSIAKSAQEAALTAGNACDLVVLGPALSKHPETIYLVQELIRHITQPILLVGDATEQTTESLLNSRKGQTFISADIGAMGRLLKRSDSRIAGNVVGELYKSFKTALPDLAKRSNTLLVITSPEAIAAAADGRLAIVSQISPDITAKHAPVLMGLLAGLLVHQSNMAFESAVVAYAIFRLLAQQSVLEKTRSEVLGAIPKVVASLAI